MKNEELLDKVDSIIESLRETQINTDIALEELQELRRDILLNEQAQEELRRDALLNEQRKQRDATSNRSAPKALQTTRQTRTGNTEQDNEHHKDRRGRTIEVGDEVNILSTGLFKGNKGTVTKLGKARVTVRLPSGRTTTRKSSNLEIIIVNV